MAVLALVVTLLALVAPTPLPAVNVPMHEHPLTSNGAYRFVNVETGGVITAPSSSKVVSVVPGNTATGTATGTDLQVRALGGGDVDISSVATGLCLTPDSHYEVTTAPCGQDNQRFTASATSGGLVWFNSAVQMVLAATPTHAGSRSTLLLRPLDHSSATTWILQAAASRRVEINARGLAPGGPPISGSTTLRLQAHVSGSGWGVRFTLSNAYGAEPLRIGAATLALQKIGAQSTSKPMVTNFAGSPTIDIPAGGVVTSDPVDMQVLAGQTLLVSVFLPEGASKPAYHRFGYATTYVAHGANAVGSEFATPFTTTTTETFLLSGVDAVSSQTKGALVTLGDSITDGISSEVDQNDRWPDQLAARLRSQGTSPVSVVNVGIGGNRIVTDFNIAAGPAAITRFYVDVTQRHGVTGVFIFEGVNDIAGGEPAKNVIRGLEILVSLARRADLKVNLVTITPFHGSKAWSPQREAARNEVNAWIRSNTVGADYVVDFDATLRDPADHSRLANWFDSGDGLHPNSLGFTAVANSIDLERLRY